MCGPKEFDPPKKMLDGLLNQEYVLTVKSSHLDIGANEAFRLRTKTRMTQLQFAQLVGVTPITVSRWERGTTKISPGYAMLIRQAVDEFKNGRKQASR